MKRRNVKNKGITLIALIITIILMLILAGVVISLTLGENGLFKTAKYAVVKDSEAQAREKLEVALADLQARKYTDDSYDEKEYIDNYLTKEDMTVEENIVLVGGWRFTIDRSVPKIGESLGKGKVKTVLITTPYIGTSSFTTKISYIFNKDEVETYTYIIDDNEINADKEYTIEGLEPESTHTVQVIVKYKDGTTIESNIVTIKTEPRIYLYNNGDQCTNITGGWKSIEVDNGANESTVKKPDLSNNLEYGVMTAFVDSDSGFQSGSITINNKIDYTKYKRLKILYTAGLTQYNAGTTIQLYKNHEEVSLYNMLASLCYEGEVATETEYSLDLSSYENFNSFYIYLQATKGQYAIIYIYEVWLEK